MIALAVTSGLAEPLLFGDGTPEEVVAALDAYLDRADWPRKEVRRLSRNEAIVRLLEDVKEQLAAILAELRGRTTTS